MKVALDDKNSRQYRNFISELRAVFARDERLYNFVCALSVRYCESFLLHVLDFLDALRAMGPVGGRFLLLMHGVDTESAL